MTEHIPGLKKGLKVYKKSEPNKDGQISLLPYYGDVRHPNDIHEIGRTATIPPDKEYKTGFAYNAIPREDKELTPLEQRQEFENLVHHITSNEALDRLALTEVLVNKIIEDEPDYPGRMDPYDKMDKIHELAEDYLAENPDLVDGYLDEDAEDIGENEYYGAYDQALAEIEENPWEYFPDKMQNIDIINGYDTQRDSPAEHRAQQMTPQRIIPLLNPLAADKAIDIANEMHRAYYDPDTVGLKEAPPTKKELLRIGRKHGMSPFALLKFAKFYDSNKDFKGPLSVHKTGIVLSKGSHRDMIRKALEDVFKHEKEYDSDLRLKNIIPSVQGRF
jgi:hypothetical protein